MELTSDDGSLLGNLDENLADRTSREYERSLNTVMNHFNNFICKCHGIDAERYPYPVYNDDYFKEVKTTSDIFGRFANFIINTVKIKKPKCVLNYISKLRMKIESENPGTTVFYGTWYRKLRLNIMKEYVKKCARDGTKLSDQVPEDVIAVTTRDQHMSDSRNAIVALSSNIAELKQAHSDEIQKLKQAHSDEIQNLKAQLNRIESLLSQRSQAPLHDTATSSIPATPVVVSNGVSVVSPWAPPEIVKVPITPIPAKCLGMITSSRSISSASVFFHWYASGLKDLNNTSLTDAQRKVFNMYRRMVHAMKHFIGPNITIPEKPSESNLQEHENWQRTIRSYAEAAVTNILSIREKQKNEEYANLSGPPTKKRRRHLAKDNVATNDDFLRKKVGSKNYPFSPAIDNLTPTWNTL